MNDMIVMTAVNDLGRSPAGWAKADKGCLRTPARPDVLTADSTSVQAPCRVKCEPQYDLRRIKGAGTPLELRCISPACDLPCHTHLVVRCGKPASAAVQVHRLAWGIGRLCQCFQHLGCLHMLHLLLGVGYPPAHGLCPRKAPPKPPNTVSADSEDRHYNGEVLLHHLALLYRGLKGQATGPPVAQES